MFDQIIRLIFFSSIVHLRTFSWRKYTYEVRLEKQDIFRPIKLNFFSKSSQIKPNIETAHTISLGNTQYQLSHTS